jgi:hypothetical protein
MIHTRSLFAIITAVLMLLSITAHAQWIDYRALGIPRMPDGKPNLNDNNY